MSHVPTLSLYGIVGATSMAWGETVTSGSMWSPGATNRPLPEWLYSRVEATVPEDVLPEIATFWTEIQK